MKGGARRGLRKPEKNRFFFCLYVVASIYFYSTSAAFAKCKLARNRLKSRTISSANETQERKKFDVTERASKRLFFFGKWQNCVITQSRAEHSCMARWSPRLLLYFRPLNLFSHRFLCHHRAAHMGNLFMNCSHAPSDLCGGSLMAFIMEDFAS